MQYLRLYLVAIVRLDHLLQWSCVDGVPQLGWATIAQAISLPWRVGLANGDRGQLKGAVHGGKAHVMGGYGDPCQLEVQLLAVLDSQQD